MELEKRVTELERQVVSLEGEYGFLGEHKHLIAFEAETRRNFESASSERSQIRSDVRSRRDDLPDIVGGAVRDALRD